MNNCWELDNGVYNKFVYNSPNEDDSKNENQDNNESQSESSVNLSEKDNKNKAKKKKNKDKKPKGADAFLNQSLDSSFKESTIKSMEDEQDLLKSQKYHESEDDNLRRMKMLLEVEKPKEELEPMNSVSSNYNFVVDDKIVVAT